MRKPVIYGVENIDQSKPAVLVANHLGAFGPVVLNVFLPFKILPWVTHEVTESGLCADYLRHDFVEPQLGLRPPWSRLVSVVIGRICVSLMGHIQAIPVYKKSRRLFVTMDKTVQGLEEGKHILIFPEIGDPLDKDTFGDFEKGFVGIARILHAKDNAIVNFYPICVDRSNNAIRIGKLMAYDPSRPLRREKERIGGYLKGSILEMLQGGGTALTCEKMDPLNSPPSALSPPGRIPELPRQSAFYHNEEHGHEDCIDHVKQAGSYDRASPEGCPDKTCSTRTRHNQESHG